MPLPDCSFVPLPKSAGLTIPAAVLALPVSLATRFVLAELLALHAWQCTPGPLAVSNAYFVQRLLLSPRTVGRTVRHLADAGHLARTAHPADRRFRQLAACAWPAAQPDALLVTICPAHA